MSDINNMKKLLREALKQEKTDLSSSNRILDNLESLDLKELIEKVNEVLLAEESAINNLSKKNIPTYFEEIRLQKFAKNITNTLFFKNDNSIECDSINKLCGNKYIGYGYFSNLNKDSYYEDHKDTFDYRQLYLSLANYYKEFYGKFSDNEEALTLLLKFFREDTYTESEIELIVQAIYHHITTAGSPTDIGYAYNGIQIIEKNIDRMSTEIVTKLLDSYEVFNIINNKVYRNQVYSLIKFSKIGDDEKEKYKFFYLDSLLIANIFNPILFELNANSSVPSYLNFDKNLKDDIIELYESEDGSKAYWTNDKSSLHNREFIVNERTFLSIELNQSSIKIELSGSNINDNSSIHFNFNKENWILDNYKTKKEYSKLKNFLANSHKSIESDLTLTLEEKKFSFSLVYLSQFRGIEEQLINFEHKYHFDSGEKALFEGEKNIIPHFYSPNIHSLTCIVGKNGTGKSSIVHFLKDYFFILMKKIIDNIVSCRAGYLEKSSEVTENIDKECNFFIVFNLNDKPYFISNMHPKSIEITNLNVEGYENGNILNESELSKVIFFSNMFTFQPELFQQSETTTKSKAITDPVSYSQLFNFRQVDYSEQSSVIYKINRINETQIINKDIVYQLIFLYHLNQNDHIKFDFLKNLSVTSHSLKNAKRITFEKGVSFKDFITGFSDFLDRIDAKIIHFSSGQYAKFSFFAKLYWCLQGHSNYFSILQSVLVEKMRFNPNMIESNFSQEDVIKADEFSLIFIDEGELYYHPEWQRLYIFELIRFIEHLKVNPSLQIVITSNSPFILSDILTEDIVYLSSKNTPNNRTLAENIHRLLTDDFYMSYTIGENSRNFIEQIIKVMGSRDESIIEEFLIKYYNQINKGELHEKLFILIDKIAEPVYRNTLIRMLEDLKLGGDSELKELQLELSLIQQKEKELQKKIQKIKK